MKKLLLVRHAKATHETGYPDFERPLTKQGIEQAETMASRLKTNSIQPQVLIASPALRTLSTANIFSQILDLPKAVTNQNIYEASEQTLLQVINNFSNQHDFIALVGHNPGISYVLYNLSGEVRDVPPGSVILIEFELESWGELHENSGKITFYSTPQD